VSVVVVGLNHRTTPLRLLEAMTVPPARAAKALHDLAGREHLSEVVIVSTCLRTEIYADAARFHAAMSEIRNFFSDWSGTPPELFSDQLYSYYDEVAVAHLFKVAAGLDSAVLGESEILGQVGDSWDAARAHHTAGPVLSALFRHALEVGKRVRSETAIARGTTSLSQAAVAVATAKLGTLSGKTTLVLGAGEMGESMAQGGALDAGSLLVVNRTWSRATQLAARCGGRAIEWSALPSALVQADVLLASTGSPDVLLVASDVESVLDQRQGRPLLIVDIAVPRDVDPAVGSLPGVTLLDMDDLTASAAVALAGRRQEVPGAQAIVAEELERYLDVAAQRQVAPLVAALYERGEAIRARELSRFRNRLADLDPAQVAAVDALTRGIVAKLLHEPTVNVKAGAGTPGGEQLAQGLRRLFELDT
jgi:glutamyl-tRNA reductase